MMNKATLYTTLNDTYVRCLLCSHQCTIPNEKSGICGVRYNYNGDMYTKAYGNVVAAAVDPVEKKPLFHFLPGSTTFSIATTGCNFKCRFCQNWEIAQNGTQLKGHRQSTPMTPQDVVQEAIETECSSIAFTYTEPTIFFEYAFEIARKAKENGLKTIFVSNGYITKEAFSRIAPYIDACNIDLKAYTDDFYKQYCDARLQPVLDLIEYIDKYDIHQEVTTLLIPGENDSIAEINNISKFIASIDRAIPWHISRFFPLYKFSHYCPTPKEKIILAIKIGYENGLKYVYGGNIDGDCNTYCYRCGNAIIRRSGRNVSNVNIHDGMCTICNAKIEGVW